MVSKVNNGAMMPPDTTVSVANEDPRINGTAKAPRNPVNLVNPTKFTRRNLPQMGSHDGGKRRKHRKNRTRKTRKHRSRKH
jgi:hypothetical protein